MRGTRGWLSLVVLVGCAGGTGPEDAGAGAGRFVPTESRALGLNDVTVLLPLDSVDAGTPLPGPEACCATTCSTGSAPRPATC